MLLAAVFIAVVKYHERFETAVNNIKTLNRYIRTLHLFIYENFGVLPRLELRNL